jgi:pimeloyl-ACP methyl ester carboxylesterase
MQLEVITHKPKKENKNRPPILCVHGGYHGAWCWDEYFLPFFAEQGYEAHALSLRGHGKSNGHEKINRWRISDYVVDLEDVVTRLPTSPILIGHSLGGIVVQNYLEEHSSPAGVLLASSPLQGMVRASTKQFFRYPIPMLKMFLSFNMIYARPTFETVFFSPGMPRGKVEAYFERMGNESFWAFMDVVFNPKLISTPMLILGGEYDISIPREVNEALAEAYNTQLETFPVAHDMMLEVNWELVASRVVNWLEEQDL